MHDRSLILVARGVGIGVMPRLQKAVEETVDVESRPVAFPMSKIFRGFAPV